MIFLAKINKNFYLPPPIKSGGVALSINDHFVEVDISLTTGIMMPIRNSRKTLCLNLEIPC